MLFSTWFMIVVASGLTDQACGLRPSLLLSRLENDLDSLSQHERCCRDSEHKHMTMPHQEPLCCCTFIWDPPPHVPQACGLEPLVPNLALCLCRPSSLSFPCSQCTPRASQALCLQAQPSSTWCNACMHAGLGKPYFDLGPTVRVHHPNLTNAQLNRRHRAACVLSAPHIPCYAQVA